MGQRLKGNFKAVLAAVKALQDAEIQKYLNMGYFEIENQRIELDEIRIIYCTTGNVNENLEVHSNNEVLVLIDMTQHEGQLEEGLAREIINRIQKLKKKASLIPTDPVEVYYELFNREMEKEDNKDSNEITIDQLQKAIDEFKSMIQLTIKSDFKSGPASLDTNMIVISETVPLKGVNMKLTIFSTSKKISESVNMKVGAEHVYIVLGEDIEARFGRSNEGTLSLVNTETMENISWDTFSQEIEVLFGLYSVSYTIFKYDKSLGEAVKLTELESSLPGSVLIISRSKDIATAFFQSEEIMQKMNKLKL